MRKIGMFLVVLTLFGMGVFAENGFSYASDSTYVATVNASDMSVGLVANPNASLTVTYAPFSFVTTGNASFDVKAMEFTSASVSEKFDFASGPFEVYVTPTFDLINDFTLTFPSAFVLTKVVPYTTVTVASDLMGFKGNAGVVTVTAEVVF